MKAKAKKQQEKESNKHMKVVYIHRDYTKTLYSDILGLLIMEVAKGTQLFEIIDHYKLD